MKPRVLKDYKRKHNAKNYYKRATLQLVNYCYIFRHKLVKLFFREKN